MAFEDRDWYRDEFKRRKARERAGETLHPLWIAAGILAALTALYQAFKPEKQTAKPASVSTPSPPLPEFQPRPRTDSGPMVIHGNPNGPIDNTPAPRPTVRPIEDPPATRTVYLCKGYSGGTFWSSALCSTQRATMDRSYTVPAHWTWEQQVAHAEREWRAVQGLYAPPPSGGRAAGIAPSQAGSPVCATLEQQIQIIDREARMPNSAWRQDQLRQERQAARSKQAELRC